jgi:EamA domain-containing membrane protein RarD
MEATIRPRFWESELFKVAVALLLLAVFSWLVLTITTAHEQARSPGETNLGVAVLGMIWGMPMLLFGASGTFLLVTHLALFSYRKFSRPKDADYDN